MPPLEHVLVVEDEPSIADAIEYNLSRAGYAVHVVTDGAEAAEADLNSYDLAVLDLMLPSLPGEEICRHWRTYSVVPVLMLTARSGVAERVLGLEVGADDYLTKPFSMPELLARVRALLRRRAMDRSQFGREQDGPPRSIDAAGLHLDLVDHSVTVHGRKIPLTMMEFRLLALLASRPGHPFSRNDIGQHLWQRFHDPLDRTCDTHVKNLRQKIEDNPARPQRLVSVRAVGYLLRAP